MTTLEATVNAPVLKTALAQVKRAIPKRTPLPICTMVHVEAGADTLTLRTTNLGIALVVTVPASVEAQGAAVLDLPGLVNIAGMGKGVVALSVNGTAEASTAGVVVPLPMQKAEDFPAIPDGSTGEHIATLDAAEFNAAIAEVIVAAAKDDTRPIMTGVRLTFKPASPGRLDPTVHLAATDGFRLHLASVLTDVHVEANTSVIVPASSLKALAQTVKSGPVSVFVTPNRNQVYFDAGAVRMVSRLIEGNFPNVERIIPTAFTSLWLLDAHSVHAMCKVAMSQSAQPCVRLEYNGSQFTAYAAPKRNYENDSITAAAIAEIDGMGEGPLLHVDLDARYLVDAMGKINPVQIELNKSEHAVRINGKHIMMPMSAAKRR